MINLTVVFHVNLNVVPLMSKSLTVKLDSVIIFTLLKQMGVQSGYINDVPVNKRMR